MPDGVPDLKSYGEHQSALGPYGTWPYIERRVHLDRRTVRTRLFSRFMLKGQRISGRRRGESINIYVDRYLPQDVTLAIAILVLNILDAVFTLSYLDGRGGQEWNPLANQLITMGRGWFMFSKAVVVAICIVFLVIHKMFRYVRPAMIFLFAFYFVLLGYHLYLHAVTPPVGSGSGL
jgi:hypothetical protein